MKVIMAVVYEVDVLPDEAEDPQQYTWERMTKQMPDVPGVKPLFYSQALAMRSGLDIDVPDFEVKVYSHGVFLHAIPSL